MDYETVSFHKECEKDQIDSIVKFLHERALKVLGHSKYEIKETEHRLGGSLMNLGWYECSQ